ncbi:GerAB/ArcD/ProY family transporter [Paenibacillus oceani]|uniref:Endospore germination permease n=1 Tax=Paenibacillus oceani TaxID=2772510 RepID=A0A927C4G6_9BACL|nr:endospore germination permease [Paenibacillus oceani]MBD2861164.1 endospore germination permease [Paenibacillus oceani]
MNRGSITFVQTTMILMLGTGLMNHVIVIPVLMDGAKRDAWISVLLAGAIFLGWSALLYTALARTRGLHIFRWLGEAYSPLLARAMASIACVYMVLISSVTLRDTATWIHLTFLPKVPILVLASLFGLLCLFNAYFGIRSIASLSVLLLPFVVAFGFFVMTANFPHKRYTLLRPMLEYGMGPVWHGVVYVGAGLIELIIILFLQQYIRTPYSVWSVLTAAFLLVGLTIGPVMGGIAEFGPELMGKLRYPAYEEWRLVTIGRYIEHLDFFSIYQWFSGAFIRISLTMFLVADLLGVHDKRRKKAVLVSVLLVSVAVAVYPGSDDQFLDALRDYVLPVVLAVMTVYSLLFIVLIHAKRRGGTNLG